MAPPRAILGTCCSSTAIARRHREFRYPARQPTMRTRLACFRATARRAFRSRSPPISASARSSTRIDQDYRYNAAGGLDGDPSARHPCRRERAVQQQWDVRYPADGHRQLRLIIFRHDAADRSGDGHHERRLFRPARRAGRRHLLRRTAERSTAAAGCLRRPAAPMSPRSRPRMARRAFAGLLLAVCCLAAAPTRRRAGAPSRPPAGEFDAEIERDFVDGMTSYAARDYRRAEAMFRRILDRDPGLLRVRLELARTLFMEKKDEQADYQFRLAAGRASGRIGRTQHRPLPRGDPGTPIVAVQFQLRLCTRQQHQFRDRQGKHRHLRPALSARSQRSRPVGHRLFFGGDASLRLNRFGKVPIYLGAYGRWPRYRDHRFDDAYAGAEAGPEVRARGRAAARDRNWPRALVRQATARQQLRRHISITTSSSATNGTSAEASWFAITIMPAAATSMDGMRRCGHRPIGRSGSTTLGFAYARVERSWANDPGQAFWRERLGVGILKEIGWGLRPQLTHRLRSPGERRQACSIREATAGLAAARNCKHLQARLERGRLRAFAEPDRHSQLFDAVALPGTARSRRDPPDEGVLKPISLNVCFPPEADIKLVGPGWAVT